jgi:hypothetical protein
MRVFVIAAAAALAAACATDAGTAGEESADAREGRDCFNTRSISGFTSVDDDTVRLNVGASRVYEVEVRDARCTQLDWASRITVEGDVSDWICVGDSPSVGRIRTDQGDVCRIDSVRRVDLEAEKAAAEAEEAEG